MTTIFYVFEETVVFIFTPRKSSISFAPIKRRWGKGVKISLRNNTFILRFQLDSHLLNERRLWKNNAATRRNSKELPNSPFALLVNNYLRKKMNTKFWRKIQWISFLQIKRINRLILYKLQSVHSKTRGKKNHSIHDCMRRTCVTSRSSAFTNDFT